MVAYLLLSLAMSALSVIFIYFLYNCAPNHAGIDQKNDMNLFKNQVKTYISGILLWPIVAIMVIFIFIINVIALLKRN